MSVHYPLSAAESFIAANKAMSNKDGGYKTSDALALLLKYGLDYRSLTNEDQKLANKLVGFMLLVGDENFKKMTVLANQVLAGGNFAEEAATELAALVVTFTASDERR